MTRKISDEGALCRPDGFAVCLSSLWPMACVLGCLWTTALPHGMPLRKLANDVCTTTANSKILLVTVVTQPCGLPGSWARFHVAKAC